MKTRLGILGCGYLGTAFLENLRSKSQENQLKNPIDETRLSTREKKIVIDPKTEFLVHFDLFDLIDPHKKQALSTELERFLDLECLVIMLPFSRRLEDPWEYVRMMEAMTALIKKSPIKKVLFTSSTSIYPNKDEALCEMSDIDHGSERAKCLCAVEKMIEDAVETSLICRIGGMVGKSRQSLRNLEGGLISAPNSPVNLIHLEDCAQILVDLIDTQSRSICLNIVCDDHPSRRAYYTYVAKSFGKALPSFDESDHFVGKKIMNTRLKKIRKADFLYPTPLGFFDDR
jgi:nucleoside-diphosphate-sugar epimerase